MGELDPTFAVKVVFDGDDDPQVQGENFRAKLDEAVAELQALGYCRSHVIWMTDGWND